MTEPMHVMAMSSFKIVSVVVFVSYVRLGLAQTAVSTAGLSTLGHSQTAGPAPPTSSQNRQSGTFIVSLSPGQSVAEVRAAWLLFAWHAKPQKSSCKY